MIPERRTVGVEDTDPWRTDPWRVVRLPSVDWFVAASLASADHPSSELRWRMNRDTHRMLRLRDVTAYPDIPTGLCGDLDMQPVILAIPVEIDPSMKTGDVVLIRKPWTWQRRAWKLASATARAAAKAADRAASYAAVRAR